jgi:hypothetical protein
MTMAKQFEVQWEGELSASPQDVWDAFTVHTDGWLWKIEYEPRVGGAERGLTSGGGTVTAWDPPRHFSTTGDRVRLTPAGLEPIEGVVDHATHPFLGVRSADALHRFYGRDAGGWPVGVAHHLFADGADATAGERAWSTWLDSVFATAEVA